MFSWVLFVLVSRWKSLYRYAFISSTFCFGLSKFFVTRHQFSASLCSFCVRKSIFCHYFFSNFLLNVSVTSILLHRLFISLYSSASISLCERFAYLWHFFSFLFNLLICVYCSLSLVWYFNYRRVSTEQCETLPWLSRNDTIKPSWYHLKFIVNSSQRPSFFEFKIW